jgi:hypothetical protein
LAGEYALLTRSARLAIGAGLAVALLSSRGRPATDFEGRDELVPTLAPLARLALRGPLTGSLAWRADLSAALATPPVSIRFADEDVARWGSPFAWATLGVELGVAGRGRDE